MKFQLHNCFSSPGNLINQAEKYFVNIIDFRNKLFGCGSQVRKKLTLN